MSQISTLFDPK